MVVVTCLTICSHAISSSATGELFADECIATGPEIGLPFVSCETTFGGCEDCCLSIYMEGVDAW